MVRIISIFAIISFVTGCSTQAPKSSISDQLHQYEVENPQPAEPPVDNDQVRRQKYVNDHPDLDPRFRDCILRSQVAIGMTEEDVRASAGSPTRVNRTTSTFSGVTVQMVYGDPLKRGHYIYLRNGKVTSMESVGEE